MKKQYKRDSPKHSTLYAKHRSGMTVIEMIVWISVFIAAMIAVSSTLLSFYRTNRYTLEQAQAVTSAQHGMDAMMRTIREAAYSSQGAFPVVSISPQDFVFYADVDSDPLIEKVHYYVQGTTLYQGIVDATGDPPAYTSAEAVSTLSEYVHNIELATSTFQYYDKNGVKIVNYSKSADVRFVKVWLIVNVNVATLPNQLLVYSNAAMRNLK